MFVCDLEFSLEYDKTSQLQRKPQRQFSAWNVSNYFSLNKIKSQGCVVVWNKKTFLPVDQSHSIETCYFFLLFIVST